SGLSLFGGGSNEAVFGGTTTPNIIKKITTTMAVVFMITSLTLTVLAAKNRGRSLAEKIPVTKPQQQQPSQAPAPAVPNTPATPK
ncbi:MAG: preprotein translocase subunit SecG, partial [Elusimicrobia bacterium RIFOXYD2_FULL_34_15]